MCNISNVSASGAVFLLAHDYSDCYKTGINIAKALIKTIQEIGPYNVIQVITDNVANCKAAREIIEDMYCYHRICTCAKPSTSHQICVTIGNICHCHLDKHFPRFSDGRRSNTREASLVTSKDLIAS